MASVIIGAVFPDVVHRSVPSLPVVPCDSVSKEHVERDVPASPLWTSAKALVTKALSRKEMFENPRALRAVQAEGDNVRSRGVWDDESAEEAEILCRRAKESGERIHIAEAMTIAGVKHAEMEEDKHVYKGRVVYRGDATKDEQGLPALFRELHSLPTNMQAINLTLFLGLCSGFLVQAADACQAFLQAPLRSPVPTYVVLPSDYGFLNGRAGSEELLSDSNGHSTATLRLLPSGKPTLRMS